MEKKDNSTDNSPLQQHSALYAAFDVYPSAKGSSTHIYHFAQSLFEQFEGGWLHVLGNPKLLNYQYEEEKQVEITRFSEDIPNFLERTQAYGADLFAKLASQKQLKIAHFRDPWSALPILLSPQTRSTLKVFEVNGLPSIEIPYRYPKVHPDTLDKIRGMEQYAWEQSDYVLSPSQGIKDNLIRLGCPEAKIQVIYNGADVPETFEEDSLEVLPNYIIYFGALQAWQGLETLLKAFTYLEDYPDLKLVICSSNREKFSKYYRKLIDKLGLEERVVWKFQLGKKDLYQWIRGAKFSVAPLKECRRNLEQGCCPLKILESMALGTAVLASDLPAVREIISDSTLGQLVRPDRPPELARYLRLGLDYPAVLAEKGQAAQKYIREYFTWEQKRSELKDFYRQISLKQGDTSE